MPPSHDFISGQRSSLLRRGVLAFWVILATLHLTQVIWFSGWAKVPGGAGDGRLNNLILEHGYQSFRGIYPFASPGQFHPVGNTLAYSDSHWGTLPLYAVARALGFSVTTAYQVWAVVLAAANAAAVLFLLRVCRVPWPLAGPLCFLSVAPAGAVWFVGGHIQLLPLFPFPLALAQVIRWSETRTALPLLLAVAFLCWLLLASPYLGFFGALALIAFGIACLFVRPRAGESPERKIDPKRTLVAAGFLLAALIPTLVLYTLYFQESRSGGPRPWSELADLAPTWRVWLTAPDTHWLYGQGSPEWRPFNLSEQALFSGWIPWLALIPALSMIRRGSGPADRTLPFVFALIALAGVVVFTDWTGDGDGLFLWLARHLDGLRAFRASGRVIVVVHLLQSMALALVLTAAWRRFNSVPARAALCGLAILAVLETLSFGQAGILKATLEARREAVVEAWQTRGDRPILVFAPAPSNQDPAAIHLDAWAAALATGRQTINGYSGRQPDGFGHFLADPTEAKAWAALHNLGLNSEAISVATSWGPAGPDLGLRQFDSQPLRVLEGFGLQPSRWELSFPVESFVIDGQPVHQFTPKATVTFELPAGAREIRFLFGLREGATTAGGDSDGVGLFLSVSAGASEIEVLNLHWNPRDREEHRGLQEMRVALPEAHDGRLTLRTDHGPAGNGLWDWPVIGRLEAVGPANQP